MAVKSSTRVASEASVAAPPVRAKVTVTHCRVTESDTHVGGCLKRGCGAAGIINGSGNIGTLTQPSCCLIPIV